MEAPVMVQEKGWEDSGRFGNDSGGRKETASVYILVEVTGFGNRM